MANPHLQAALDKYRKEMESGVYYGYKRDYFERNLKQILELVAAGVPHTDIIAAFEKDGIEMSKRYFSRLLNDVRYFNGLPSRNRHAVPDI